MGHITSDVVRCMGVALFIGVGHIGTLVINVSRNSSFYTCDYDLNFKVGGGIIISIIVMAPLRSYVCFFRFSPGKCRSIYLYSGGTSVGVEIHLRDMFTKCFQKYPSI